MYGVQAQLSNEENDDPLDKPSASSYKENQMTSVTTTEKLTALRFGGTLCRVPGHKYNQATIPMEALV